MASPYPIIIPDDGSGQLEFDLVLSESHTNSSTATDYPVETGVNPTDNVRPDPIEYSCDVWMTNTPKQPDPVYGGDYEPVTLVLPPSNPLTQPIASSVSGAISSAISGPLVAQMLTFPGPFDRVNDQHVALTTLERSGGTSTVITSTATYTDMVLTKVAYSKQDAGSGTFSLEFKNILVVTSSTVAAPKPIEPRGTPAKATGSQAAKPADAAGASLAKKAINAITGAFGGSAPP